MSIHPFPLNDYALTDRYTQTTGRVFMTGTQALVRIMLDQGRRDRQAGLNTGGFVSGYRGSPLGGLDRELWSQKKILADRRIEFLPAVNEDLAATAVLGSQQVETHPDREVDGVFGLWYGKGPGVDRSGDALRHGNAYGTSPRGGVLVVAGDDHGCVSSSMPHQSDAAFLAWFMPVLNPANVAEYLQFGEYGYALSRFCGMWVGFKAISETVESAASIELHEDRIFRLPEIEVPSAGLHYRWLDLPSPDIELRMEAKKRAVLAFAEANPIDRRIYNPKNARVGFVSTGKGHLDLMEALRLLGVDEASCRRLGIDIYKVGMVWPLAKRQALDFVRGKDEVVIIEEKRGIIESQFKEYFYDLPGEKPKRMVGKNDENGERLIPWVGELSPRLLVPLIAKRLHRLYPDEGFAKRAEQVVGAEPVQLDVSGSVRTPYFCSGCPHNTSTRVPEGSKAQTGIGCHVMSTWMDRDTAVLTHMGGEGVAWTATSRFTGKGHVFQNMGEGTWYHSGSMAVRQAIAAGANLTYKILYNDAVAMTGGQPVDGPISVEAIASASRAEGVDRIALVSSEPEKFSGTALPQGTTIHHRSELDTVQRELREIPGVSVLIYEQACATELRRRRKRGEIEAPNKHVVINELVCEGCGDCSVASNCLSVEPVETEFGRKRRINQSSCNKDFSCLEGFCPSFVTIEGGQRRKAPQNLIDLEGILSDLTLPKQPDLSAAFDLLVAGVGGTGVVTVGALVTMAAHLEGKGTSVLDFTGFSQKYGSVLSYVRIARDPHQLHQVRIDEQSAHAMIACDGVVASSPKAVSSLSPDTQIVLNEAKVPTGELVLNRDASLQMGDRISALADAVGAENFSSFDANRLSESVLGDSVFANIILLGAAWQAGMVPVSLEALLQAIRLNGVAVEKNQRAFELGRVMAAAPDKLLGLIKPEQKDAPSLEALVKRRTEFLSDYQNRKWAERYRDKVTALADRTDEQLATVAAKSLFKLMSYKDEYEVARLHGSAAFRDQISKEFEGDIRVIHHLAPPFLGGKKDWRGRPVKRAFGRSAKGMFTVLRQLKALRGTPFDPFGYTAERRLERELIGWFEGIMEQCGKQFDQRPRADWMKALAAPLEIRGYGPVKEAAAAKVVNLCAEVIGDTKGNSASP